MAESKKHYFDFMADDGAEQCAEWASQINFNVQRREIFESSPIPLERLKEIVEKFRNMREAEASYELFKLDHPRERAAAMIGLTERTKKRKISQEEKTKCSSWSMDEVVDDFVTEFKKPGVKKTTAAKNVAKNHGMEGEYAYKTVLRHAEERGLI